MGTDFSKRISLALQCIPFKEEHANYLASYRKAHPEQEAEFKEIADCLDSKEVKSCVEQKFGEKPFDPSLPSAHVKQYCERAALYFGQNLAVDEDGYTFTSEAGTAFLAQDSYAKEFTPLQYQSLEEVTRFYYQRLRPWLPPLTKYLRGLPAFQNNLKKYDEIQASSKNLSPAHCKNSAEWQRFDLEIQGVSFRVPVFFPKREQQRWWWYRDILQAQFEVLKGFLPPEALEKMLHPQEGADLGLYIGGSGDKTGIHQRCGFDDEHVGGQFLDHSNMVIILQGNWRMQSDQKIGDAQISAITNKVANTFYHEMAHAIEHHLLSKDSRLAIDALQHWTLREAGSDKEKFNLAPIPTHFGVNDQRPYSLRNGNEFFANWVAEYFILKAKGETPTEPALAARSKILDDFFANGKLNPEAFTAANIEKRYSEQKISVHLASRGLTFSLKFGPTLGHINSTAGPLTGLGYQFGAGLGYLYQRQPQGLVIGGGVSYDYSSAGDQKNRDLELQDQFRMSHHDVGAWMMAGYNFGTFDVFLQPVLGYRKSLLEHYLADDKTNVRSHLDTLSQDAFFGGAELGVSNHKLGMGLRFGARHATDGSWNTGLLFNFDPISIFRFKDSGDFF